MSQPMTAAKHFLEGERLQRAAAEQPILAGPDYTRIAALQAAAYNHFVAAQILLAAAAGPEWARTATGFDAVLANRESVRPAGV